MMQSKKDDNITVTLGDNDCFKLEDIVDTDSTITINLNDTYGTTTTYFSGDTITDKTTDLGNYTLSGDFGDMQVDQSWQAIYPGEVDRMCKEYPALEKVWRNFKSVYDMVKQDYEGKKEAGEIEDDDIPF